VYGQCDAHTHGAAYTEHSYCYCCYVRSSLQGYNECIEPYTSNMYVRRVKAGEFIVINPHLFKDLMKMGLWNEDTRSRLVADGGSVANIKALPAEMKEIYKTVWEIKQKTIIDLAAGVLLALYDAASTQYCVAVHSSIE
jgi:ribonucleotide reductase alpha subunit